jgi:hypothetical protein
MAGPNLVRELFIALGVQFDAKGIEQFESRLKTFNAFVKTGLVANMQQFAGSVERVGKQFENLISRPITDFVTGSVQAFAELESLQAPFKSLIPDAQKMRDLFNEFAGIKKLSIFNDKEIYDYGLQLVKIQTPLDKVSGMIKKAALVSLGNPALTAELMRILGHGESTDLINQRMATQFPALMDVLAEKVNPGAKGLILRRKMNLGMANYKDLLDAIDELAERQRYAMIFQANTLNGLYSIIANNIDTIKKKVGDWIEKNVFLKRVLVTIAVILEDFINSFDKIPNRTKWILFILAGVIAALPVIITFLGGIASVIVTIAGAVFLFTTFAGIFAAIGTALTPIILLLLEVVLVLGAATVAAMVLSMIFNNWKELLSDIYFWFDKLIGHPFMKGFQKIWSTIQGGNGGDGDFGDIGFRSLGSYLPGMGTSSTVQKTINVNVQANLPQGTSDDHVQYVKDGIHQAVQDELSYQLYNTDNSNEWSMLSNPIGK